MREWGRCLLVLSPPFLAWLATYASYEAGLPSLARDNLIVVTWIVGFLVGIAALATAPLRLPYKVALGVIFSVLAPLLMLLAVLFADCTRGACL